MAPLLWKLIGTVIVPPSCTVPLPTLRVGPLLGAASDLAITWVALLAFTPKSKSKQRANQKWGFVFFKGMVST